MSSTMVYPTESAYVVQLANQYAAVCVVDNKITKFISKQLTDDCKVAQVAAKTFAQERNLSCELSKVLRFDEPIITITAHEELWHPTAIYANKAQLIKEYVLNNEVINVKGSFQKEEAIQHAQLIATVNSLSYLQITKWDLHQ